MAGTTTRWSTLKLFFGFLMVAAILTVTALYTGWFFNYDKMGRLFDEDSLSLSFFMTCYAIPLALIVGLVLFMKWDDGYDVIMIGVYTYVILMGFVARKLYSYCPPKESEEPETDAPNEDSV